MNQINDEHSEVRLFIPPLLPIADEGFTDSVLVRTRLIKWRYDAMFFLAWVCFSLSTFIIVPWQTAASGIQQFLETRLLQSLQQLAPWAQGLQSDLAHQLDLNQSILVVAAACTFCAVMLYGLFAED
ncbi:MAG: hypothetical protein Q7L07_13920 [Pseudohongiella sp.]|nr:hypothetical protein [Pseudohongiella sp.]MDP2286344.1 hypothetical protein [Pseudohongiella sp.]